MREASHPPALPAGNDYLPITRAAKGATINLFGAVVRTVAVALYAILLARILPVTEFGNYSLMFAIVNLLGLVSVAGLDFGVVRHVSMFAGRSDYRSARKTMYAALYLGIPFGLTVALAFYLAAPALAGSRLFDGNEMVLPGLRIFSLTIPLWVAASLFSAVTQGMHRMEYQVYSRDMGEQISRFALTMVAVVIGAGFLGIIWANLAAMVLATLMAMAFALKVIPAGGEMPGRGSPARMVYIYSLPLAFSNVIGIILLKVDILMLGYLGTSEGVGYYAAALRIVMIGSTILMAFGTMFAPMISDLYGKGQLDVLATMFKTVARWIFIFSFPIFVIMAVFPRLVMLVFGAEYVEGSNALILLAFGQLLNAGTGTAGLMVLMSGRSRMELLNVSVALLVNIVLCILLIPEHGIIGAAIANMAAAGTVNLCRVVEVWIFMRIHAYGINFLKPLIAGLSGGGLLLVVLRFVAIDAGAPVEWLLVGAFLAYYVAVTVLMGLDKNDRTVLRLLRSRLTRAKTA